MALCVVLVAALAGCSDDPRYLTHRYLRAGEVEATVDTTWSAQWRVGNGPWADVLGTVTRTGTPVQLAAVTARPQLLG